MKKLKFFKKDFEIISSLDNGYLIKVGCVSLPLFIRDDYYVFNESKVYDYEDLKHLVNSLKYNLSRELHPQTKFVKSVLADFPQLIVSRVDWFENLVALDLRLIGAIEEQVFVAYKKDAMGKERFMAFDTWYPKKEKFTERVNLDLLYLMENNKKKLI